MSRPSGVATPPSAPDGFVASGDWTLHSVCGKSDERVWYGPEGEDKYTRQLREARAVCLCRQCPVQDVCLLWAMGQPEDPSPDAVVGGLTSREREVLRADAYTGRRQLAL